MFAGTLNTCYSEAQVFTRKIPKGRNLCYICNIHSKIRQISYPIIKKLKILLGIFRKNPNELSGQPYISKSYLRERQDIKRLG